MMGAFPADSKRALRNSLSGIVARQYADKSGFLSRLLITISTYPSWLLLPKRRSPALAQRRTCCRASQAVCRSFGAARRATTRVSIIERAFAPQDDLYASSPRMKSNVR
jgi:hypothetical protein